MAGPTERPATNGRPMAVLLALVWLIAIAGFVWLAHHAATQPISELDFRLSVKISTHADPLGPILRIDNRLGGVGAYGVLLATLIVIMFWRRCWIEGVFLVSVLAPALAVAVIKRVVEETPPMMTQATALAHQRFSFPSGHVVGLTVLFGLIFIFARAATPSVWLARIVQAGCFAIVATVGIARIWAFAHWPNDVVAGYLLAIVFLIPTIALYFRFKRHADAGTPSEIRPSQIQPLRLK